MKEAKLDDVILVDCMFLNTIAPDVTINNSCVVRVQIKESNFLCLKVLDSLVDNLAIKDSNLAGSSWMSVTSEHGWIISGVDLTASTWSLSDVPHSSWSKVQFFGVVIERCNFWRNRIAKCNYEMATLKSVGFNDTKFESCLFTNIKASALRLRVSTFSACTLTDTRIEDSFFEFSKLFSSIGVNLQIVRPTYTESTIWPDGYNPPDTQPHSTDHPKNN